MTKKARLALGSLVVAFALAQAIPVPRTNPPVEATVDAPPAVLAALRKSCWDCHSNETVWGWHTRIAPASWLVASDVNEGREELNFSRWNAVDAKRLAGLAKKIPEEVGEGEMPPLLYELAHPSARPSDAEKAAIVEWARTLPAARPAPSLVHPASSHDRDDAAEHGERH